MAGYAFPQQPNNECSIHYRPDLLSDAVKARGIYFDTLPAEPAPNQDCIVALIGNKATGEVWWEQIPIPPDYLAEHEEMGREEIRAVARSLTDVDSLTDEQLWACLAIYPAWAVDTAYWNGVSEQEPGLVPPQSFVVYGEQLYSCTQSHTSQATWTPPVVPALWTKRTPAGTVAEWVQPLGAHDAYAEGAVVLYDGQKWVSTVAANVWRPGEYGWLVV